VSTAALPSDQRSESLELGQILVRQTRLSPEQLQQARLRQIESHERLADILVEEGFLNADEVLQALGHQQGLAIISNIDPEEIDETLLPTIPITFAKQHRLLPLNWAAEGVLRVAVADPLDVAPIDDLHLLFDGAEIEIVLARESVILSAINLAYDRRRMTISTRWPPRPPTSPRIYSNPPKTHRSFDWSIRCSNTR